MEPKKRFIEERVQLLVTILVFLLLLMGAPGTQAYNREVLDRISQEKSWREVHENPSRRAILIDEILRDIVDGRAKAADYGYLVGRLMLLTVRPSGMVPLISKDGKEAIRGLLALHNASLTHAIVGHLNRTQYSSLDFGDTIYGELVMSLRVEGVEHDEIMDDVLRYLARGLHKRPHHRRTVEQYAMSDGTPVMNLCSHVVSGS